MTFQMPFSYLSTLGHLEDFSPDHLKQSFPEDCISLASLVFEKSASLGGGGNFCLHFMSQVRYLTTFVARTQLILCTPFTILSHFCSLLCQMGMD